MEGNWCYDFITVSKTVLLQTNFWNVYFDKEDGIIIFEVVNKAVSAFL